MAPASAAPKDRLSETEAALVQRAIDRGTLIYAYDRVAWHGTDDLKAKLPDFARKVRGWIVDGPADAPQLVFYDQDEADPRIVYRADFKGTQLVSSRILTESDDRSLSPGRKAMVAARRAALKAIVAAKAMFCSRAMPNTVILPPASPAGPTLVYVLTPQSTLKSIPLGGHHLVEVSADGEAGKPRAFTKSCLEMPFEQKGGDRPAALMVTHLLDPVPTELHVFSSLAARLPIYVSTQSGKRTRLWETAGSRIRLVSDKPSR
ncbi:MAG TPA: hypothetical protein VF782_14175 [Allosphingosinicella sp.]